MTKPSTSQTLLALGDSHLEALRLAADLNLLDAQTVDFCIVPGATAVGLRNPNSATQALPTFLAFVADRARSDRILIQLGEVDCGFVTWWRAQQLQESVEDQLQASLAALEAFLDDLQKRGFRHLCLTGAVLPTIADGDRSSVVANLRSQVSADLRARTRLTLQYNLALASMAGRRGAHYFDLTAATLDARTGVVADHFRNADPADHHLAPDRVADFWADGCNDFLRRCATRGT